MFLYTSQCKCLLIGPQIFVGTWNATTKIRDLQKVVLFFILETLVTVFNAANYFGIKKNTGIQLSLLLPLCPMLVRVQISVMFRSHACRSGFVFSSLEFIVKNSVRSFNTKNICILN